MYTGDRALLVFDASGGECLNESWIQHLRLLFRAEDDDWAGVVPLAEQLTDEPFLAEFGHLLFCCGH